MRNAVTLLAVVALIVLTAGAFNNGVVFNIDYVAGTASSVSLFWVSAVIAAVVFVAGLAASWFALSGASGARRKLEGELQATYERLRRAERQATEASAEAEAAKARVDALSSPAASAVEPAASAVAGSGTSVAATEPATVVVAPEHATAPVEPEEATVAAAGADTTGPGEQTAVTSVAGGGQAAAQMPDAGEVAADGDAAAGDGGEADGDDGEAAGDDPSEQP